MKQQIQSAMTLLFFVIAQGLPFQSIAQVVCPRAIGYKNLDGNEVQARIYTNGDGFWDHIDYALFRPDSSSAAHSLFANALWLSSIDSLGQCRVAAMTYYRASDYYAGPLTNVGGQLTAYCGDYDRI